MTSSYLVELQNCHTSKDDFAACDISCVWVYSSCQEQKTAWWWARTMLQRSHSDDKLPCFSCCLISSLIAQQAHMARYSADFLAFCRLDTWCNIYPQKDGLVCVHRDSARCYGSKYKDGNAHCGGRWKDKHINTIKSIVAVRENFASIDRSTSQTLDTHTLSVYTAVQS
jgi:hypothetical protein